MEWSDQWDVVAASASWWPWRGTYTLLYKEQWDDYHLETPGVCVRFDDVRLSTETGEWILFHGEQPTTFFPISKLPTDIADGLVSIAEGYEPPPVHARDNPPSGGARR